MTNDAPAPTSISRELIETRLIELNEEGQKAVNLINQHNKQVDELKATVLRIDGAVMVLHELLAPKEA